jgi:hypothetical protein
VRKRLLSLATLCAVTLITAPGFAQVNSGSISTVDQGPFNLAEAYPCTAGTYAAGLGIAGPGVFTGTCPARAGNPGAAPGILSLLRSGNVLNANCFIVIPPHQVPPCFVQAYRLTKQVPGSFKCPDVYGLPHFDANGNLIPYQYFQFSSGVRTWWTLNFTQPGTRFILEVVSVCRTDTNSPLPGTPVLHKDRWTWRVVADANTLGSVIDLMHEGAVGTLEIPCILGEDMYEALKTAQLRLANAIDEADDASHTRLTDIGNAVFDTEALIVANCLFVELLNPMVAFPGPAQFGAPNIQPPGNLAASVVFQSQGSAVAGIIDTIEHPCCCKLLVDLEWITIRQGLAGTSPTLPTF